MQVAKETITPKKAMEWLKRNVNNRPLNKRNVDSIAATISRKEWVLNAETIKFNENGDLLDGQHRLNAILIAGIPIESYVARGLPHEAFDTFDQQDPRRPTAVFARMGEQNYKHLATAVKLVWELESGVSDNRKMTNPQATKFIADNPGLRDSVSFCGEIDVRLMMSHGQSAALHYMMSKKDPVLADEFWKSVATGEGLSKSMPAYQLRQRLIENRATKITKLRRRMILALAIKAWNCARAKQPVKCLRWDQGREDFPAIQ